MLAALGQTKLAGSGNGVDRVGTGIGEADNFRSRTLRLKNVGGEVTGGERVTHAADNFTAIGFYHTGHVGFQCMAEGVIRSE